MRILIIEDDSDFADDLKEKLEMEAFTVDIEHQGDKGSYTARTNDYDCIILDYILPNKDGRVVCAEIRSAGRTAPIIMLTAVASTEKKVALLDCGADDYLTKPFSFDELLARIRAVTRRQPALVESLSSIDNLTLDRNRQRVHRGGQGIYLTRKEFSLLEFMLRHRGLVVSRGMIMEHVWSAEANPFSNTIEAHILNLRRKTELEGTEKRLIHSVPGRGYKIDVEK